MNTLFIRYSLAAAIAVAPLWAAAAKDQPAAGQGEDLLATVDAALAWHPMVRNAVGLLEESGEYIAVARSGYFPQVTGGIGTDYRQHIPSGQEDRMINKLNISASQMIYDFGKVASSVDSATASRTIAEGKVLMAVDQVAKEAAQSALELMRYQALTRIAADQVEGVSALAKLASERRALGAATRSDEVQAQSRVEAAEASKMSMEAEAAHWQGNLRHLTGQRVIPLQSGDVPPTLHNACFAPEPNWNNLPSVLVAQAEQEKAEHDLKNMRSQSLPTISVEGSANHALNERPYYGSKNDSTVGVNLSVPMYRGGSLRAQQRAAGHALDAAAASSEYARLTASQGLTESRARTRGFQSRLTVLEAREQSIDQTRGLYRQQYLDLGTRTLLDLLNAEQEYHQARIERVNNTYDMYRTQVDCLYNQGSMRSAFALEGKTIAGVEIQP